MRAAARVLFVPALVWFFCVGAFLFVCLGVLGAVCFCCVFLRFVLCCAVVAGVLLRRPSDDCCFVGGWCAVWDGWQGCFWRRRRGVSLGAFLRLCWCCAVAAGVLRCVVACAVFVVFFFFVLVGLLAAVGCGRAGVCGVVR